MSSEDTIATLVKNRRVLITVGAGGVGKTTTAAALGVAAARLGRNVLCLTIDPAKRLAESLGIERMSSEAMLIEPARFEAAGISVTGSLTAMMLDTKRTFDELILKYSSSEAKAKALLNNKLYQYVSTSLAGTQEYMAMEKLVAVKADPKWDLVILDTPPTANALDFLDAPERLMDALDSATMKWFVQAFQSTGTFSLNILAKSASVVLRGIGKITGGGFLESMAEFITELNDLFGGFKQRAQLVKETLRNNDVAFILVTSPSPMSLREVMYFSERLAEYKMPRGAFVVNRFRFPPPCSGIGATEDAARSAIAKAQIALEEDAPERLVKAHSDAVRLSNLDASHLKTLEVGVGAGVPMIRIPELPSDVHDVRLLGQLSELLMSGGR